MSELLQFVLSLSLEPVIEEDKQVYLDDRLFIEKLSDMEAKGVLDKLSGSRTTATLSQLLAPTATTLNQLNFQEGLYRMVIDDPKVKEGLLNGTLTQATLKRNGLYTSAIMKKDGIAHQAGLQKVGYNLFANSLQLASFVAGQYQLAQINASLKNIESQLDEILTLYDDELSSKLDVCIIQACDLIKYLNLEASVPTTKEQKIDFDNRLSSLETRSLEVLEICNRKITRLQKTFENKRKENEQVTKKDMMKATEIFEKWVKCIRLNFILARLYSMRDNIRNHHSEFHQLSQEKCERAQSKMEELKKTIEMFDSKLLEDNTWTHKFMAFFSSTIRKENAQICGSLESWKDYTLKDLDEKVQNSFILEYTQDKEVCLVSAMPEM